MSIIKYLFQYLKKKKKFSQIYTFNFPSNIMYSSQTWKKITENYTGIIIIKQTQGKKAIST